MRCVSDKIRFDIFNQLLSRIRYMVSGTVWNRCWRDMREVVWVRTERNTGGIVFEELEDQMQ